jgi:Fe-S-cluster-containing hydrogenase component 2
MVSIRDRSGAFILTESTNVPLEKATKCDLCIDQLGGPACARACPHDALKRVDMRDTKALVDWINR